MLIMYAVNKPLKQCEVRSISRVYVCVYMYVCTCVVGTCVVCSVYVCVYMCSVYVYVYMCSVYICVYGMLENSNPALMFCILFGLLVHLTCFYSFVILATLCT